jgi:hypothetical protein
MNEEEVKKILMTEYNKGNNIAEFMGVSIKELSKEELIGMLAMSRRMHDETVNEHHRQMNMLTGARR